MKLNVRAILLFGIVMLMFISSINTEAFDLDPGDGDPDNTRLKITVSGIRLAKDGDPFNNPGEIYMTNPGTDLWTSSNAKSWEDYTVYISPGVYYGGYHAVPYTMVYETDSFNIGDKFWFNLRDKDWIGSESLWNGYVKVTDPGCISSKSTWSARTTGLNSVDLGPVIVMTWTASRCVVGGGQTTYYAYNQLYFTITYYHA